MQMLGGKIVWKIFLVEKVYSVMCTFNSAPQFVEEALLFLSLGQPLTIVSIPQHEPSEAWGGPGSRHHNGSGFTIATVGLGPLLL